MTQIAFISIAAETELANICTSGIYPICPRLSQARGFQHHLAKSSCQPVSTPGPLPEKTNLDWDYIVLSIIKLDCNQATHLVWGNWFFNRASQSKPQHMLTCIKMQYVRSCYMPNTSISTLAFSATRTTIIIMSSSPEDISLDGLQQEKPSRFFMATPRLSAPSARGWKIHISSNLWRPGSNNIIDLVPMVRRNWRGHPEEYLQESSTAIMLIAQASLAYETN